MKRISEKIPSIQEGGEIGTVSVTDLRDVLRRGQCIGCGFCTVPLTTQCPSEIAADSSHTDDVEIQLGWSPELEHWVPQYVNAGSADNIDAVPSGAHREARRICPGAKMNMRAISHSVFGREPEDVMAGEIISVHAGYAANEDVRRQGASGGVTTALLNHLFNTEQIDAAYCAVGRNPKSGRGILLRSASDLPSAMGSHYHPVNFGAGLDGLARSDARFAFVGLPCEIAALRQLMLFRSDIAERCVVTIGLFCGGINRYSGIGRYLKRFNIKPDEVEEIDYRYGSWPGRIKYITRDGASSKTIPRIHGNSRWNILHYMISFQGYWMLPRCRICPDQIADFADIAVGDPHLSRFKTHDSAGYSAIIARTEKGIGVLRKAREAGVVVLENLTRDEVVASQGYTLENRRHTKVYTKVASVLGITPPDVSTYSALPTSRSRHQYVYAFVDLWKIRVCKVGIFRPFYLPFQIFEYLFLTLSPRLVLTRLRKLATNK